MSDPRTDTLVAADAVRRIGEELSHLSGGLRAVEEGRFWAMDATRLFSRCTPQAVVSGARALASVMHPDRAGTPTPADAVRITLP